MQSPARLLIFQTAFTGDVILTLPLVQTLYERLPDVLIDVVVVPGAAQVIAHHPAIHTIIVYDKKGKEKGWAAAYALIKNLRRVKYDVAIVPHRSIRSAAICHFAGIPRLIGFSTSAGRFLFTDIVKYDNTIHEVARNLSLLRPIEISVQTKELPHLYPSHEDARVVDELLSLHPSINTDNMVAIAPGSIWATKRWLPERYKTLCEKLISEGFSIVLIGGMEDLPIGKAIESGVMCDNVMNAMGKLTMLQSAELIGRCRLAISNDSSPMHIAVAMRTPVVAIFGATVPEFGFAPLGEHDEVVQTPGLECRPCAIHGGSSCPIKTFVCMKNIHDENVLEKVHAVLSKAGVEVT